MSAVLNRFLEYVRIDTQSDASSKSYPSTQGQCDFLRMMHQQLIDLGLSDVTIDDHCYVMATLKANCDEPCDVIGFIAHVDTSPDLSGRDVNPQIREYKGGDIVLNSEQGIVMSVEQFPELNSYIGQTLVTTDGTTLLGADDKAGVAEIMTAMEYLIAHPEIKHGDIRVAFTADEEIGCGVDYFDVERFGAAYAYTMDGGGVGELEYETFNAASAKITINGRNIHPGYAKDKMINSLSVAAQLDMMLPQNERPQYTQGYEGFYHLISVGGSVDNAHVDYIIRDHDKAIFAKRKELMRSVVALLGERYGEGVLELEIKDSYYNMAEAFADKMYIVDRAREAMERLGIKPNTRPIRGGTDGSRLSFMNLPTPNIFTGAENFHGRYEFVAVESMELAVKTIVEISKIL